LNYTFSIFVIGSAPSFGSLATFSINFQGVCQKNAFSKFFYCAEYFLIKNTLKYFFIIFNINTSKSFKNILKNINLIFFK